MAQGIARASLLWLTTLLACAGSEELTPDSQAPSRDAAISDGPPITDALVLDARPDAGFEADGNAIDTGEEADSGNPSADTGAHDGGVDLDAMAHDATPSMDATPGMDALPGQDAAPPGDAGDPDANVATDAGPPPNCPPGDPSMTFFVTEYGSGPNGGDLGGLVGADLTCATAAAAVGISAGTWRAYLSTSTIDARDRIGAGPWINYAGVDIGDLEDIHFENGGDGIALPEILTECGRSIRASDVLAPNQSWHDILTGSNFGGRLQRAIDGNGLPTGAPMTCDDWTSSAAAPHQAWVGHTDYAGGTFNSWQTAHATLGCTEAQLLQSAGSGGVYCFAQ